MQLADAEGFNVRRRQHRSIRFGEDVEVRRSPQAVACRKRCVCRTREAPKVPGRLGLQRIQDQWYTIASEMLNYVPGGRWTGHPDIPLHADGVSYQAYYSEVGKAHHMGKDLTEVRSPQRKLVPDNVGLEQYEQTSLRGIAIKAKACAKHRFQRSLPVSECPIFDELLEGFEQECCQRCR